VAFSLHKPAECLAVYFAYIFAFVYLISVCRTVWEWQLTVVTFVPNLVVFVLGKAALNVFIVLGTDV
jgi:uncharacterized membrane protein